jgi:hypothetical protein
VATKRLTTFFDFNSQIGYNTLKEINMRGSIRALVGFLIAFGAVGGIENGEPLMTGVLLALAGLGIMASGVSAMNEVPAGLSR